MLFTIHAPDEVYLQEVIAKMRDLGPPTIRVANMGDSYQALEGVHRLEAARRLGLVPHLIVFDPDYTIGAHTLDWTNPEQTAGELARDLRTNRCGRYEIETDGKLRRV